MEEAQLIVPLQREGAARSTEAMETELDSQQNGGENGFELEEEREGEVSLEREGTHWSTEVVETELHCRLTIGETSSELRGTEWTSPFPVQEETALLSPQTERQLAQSEGIPKLEDSSRTTEHTCEGTSLLETEVDSETKSARNISKPSVRKLNKRIRTRFGESTTHSEKRNHSLTPLAKVFNRGVERCEYYDSTMVSADRLSHKKDMVLEQNLAVNQAEFERRDKRTVELSDKRQHKSDIAFRSLSRRPGSSTADEQLGAKHCILDVVTTVKKDPGPGDDGYCSRQVSRQDSQMSEDSPHMYRSSVDRQRSSGKDSAIGDTSGSDSDHGS